MKHLYELERTITDAMDAMKPDDEDFIGDMARRIHEQHIQPLLNRIERLEHEKRLADIDYED